jgi:hypothetical protein
MSVHLQIKQTANSATHASLQIAIPKANPYYHGSKHNPPKNIPKPKEQVKKTQKLVERFDYVPIVVMNRKLFSYYEYTYFTQ